jgi:hypothetical protein
MEEDSSEEEEGVEHFVRPSRRYHHIKSEYLRVNDRLASLSMHDSDRDDSKGEENDSQK